MNTPTQALAWELWRRHRPRLMIIIGLVAAFAWVYPAVCARAGFNLNSATPLEELVIKFVPQGQRHVSASQIVQVLYILALACGPAAVMLLSLLYLTWMFTFTAPDPKTKDPMAFPARLFTLPLSTPFLFWWLFLAGQAGIILLYKSWVHFVGLPRLEMFAAYQNCFGWMTVVALAQGIVWALAAWPFTRMLILSALFFCFALSPTRQELFNSPLVLPPLFLLGVVLARAGLEKMRHGQWQGWTWEQMFPRVGGRAELRGPKQFASPAQAQLWFEWRRSSRRLCIYIGGASLLPVLAHVLVRFIAGWGPLQEDTMLGFIGCLLIIPLFLHFGFGLSSGQDLPFTMLRPLTNGQIMMATLKATAISTVVSWALVVVALFAMPLLGNFDAVEKSWGIQPNWWPLIILALMLLTWRSIAVNLCFVWSGNRRLSRVPTWLGMAAYMGGVTLALLSNNSEYWNAFCRALPFVLTGLVAVKFLLALAAFRVSLKRQLLAPRAAAAYLAAWPVLAAVLLIPTLILFHDKEGLYSACVGIVLLTPLARIGFCPITLAWNRHA